MAKQLQIRGGTTVQHSTFTGALREITIDTDKDVVVVHDGTTAGGFPLAKQTSVDSKVTKVTSTDNAVVRFNGGTGEVQNSGVIINDNGNVGLNANPSNLGTLYRGINIFDNGELFSSGVATFLSNNLYHDGTSYKYKNNGAASVLYQTGETLVITTATSGLAGATATLNNKFSIDNNAIDFGSSTMSGNRTMIIDSGSIGNNEFVSFQARAGLSGTLNRYMSIQVYKHSGITNPCGALQQSQQNGTAIYYWTDDVGVLRNSTVSTNIGTTGGGVVGTQTSDERVKNIVGTCPYGLQEILELETYKYSMKDDVEGSFKLGFVAQQAMGVIPESVYDTNERLTEAVTVIKQKVIKEAVKDEEGNILEPEVVEDYEDVEYQETADTVTKLAMDYQMMIPVLVNAVKEQQELINSLTARLDRLEGNL